MVAQVARQYQDSVQIIGVPGRDSLAAMRKFVERHGLGFLPHAADPDGDVWDNLGVRYQPTWIFVNGADGKATVEFGDLEANALQTRLDRLVAQ